MFLIVSMALRMFATQMGWRSPRSHALMASFASSAAVLLMRATEAALVMRTTPVRRRVMQGHAWAMGAVGSVSAMLGRCAQAVAASRRAHLSAMRRSAATMDVVDRVGHVIYRTSVWRVPARTRAHPSAVSVFAGMMVAEAHVVRALSMSSASRAHAALSARLRVGTTPAVMTAVAGVAGRVRRGKAAPQGHVSWCAPRIAAIKSAVMMVAVAVAVAALTLRSAQPVPAQILARPTVR